MHDKLGNKMLTALDEYSRQALAAAVRIRMGADDVLDALCPLLLRHVTPEYTRARTMVPSSAHKHCRTGWLGSPSNPSESFPDHPGERIQRMIQRNPAPRGAQRRRITTTKQAQIVINQWLRQYNDIRPNQALNMWPPAPETLVRNGTELGGYINTNVANPSSTMRIFSSDENCLRVSLRRPLMVLSAAG